MSTESDHFPDDTTPKRRRRRSTSNSTVDRISELTDPLLVYILSFLSIEDAIKTQVLSKRWRYLFTELPSLVFRCYHSDSTGRDIGEFADFVDKTLDLFNNCSKLNKFAVDFGYNYDPRIVSKVNMWTRLAAEKGTEVLHLDLHTPEEHMFDDLYYELPQHLYSNSSFRELHFSRCMVKPKGVVNWSSLKKLSIGYAILNEEMIETILVGSPVLEILELYYLYGFDRLHFSNASLKKLILREHMDHSDFFDYSDLEISAPNLESLEILGSLDGRDFRLVDVSSLVDATLNFHLRNCHRYDSESFERNQNILRRLLESLAHVQNITLGNWALQVLSIMEAIGLVSPPLKCVSLTLDAGINLLVPSKIVLPGIANLLGNSPNLETLVITMSSICDSERCGKTLTKLCCDIDEKLYWTSKKRTFECLMLHLRTVKFVGVRWLYRDFHISFAQFLLENARMLQKMVIDALRDDVKPTAEVRQKLLRFPRSSPNAIVLFY
ncbi:hypothetical protein Vadar_000146 [Vaccinium darrowii]|uniref:Uncharacterized protein n=1 Tax=Vaccinium darrowii TaxID=229202 RepID=A0ACB7X6L2_9ERIC|nr:hypothetical protein Vadar_000146 [Vaccinium darrowii]